MYVYFPMWQGSGKDDSIYYGANLAKEKLKDKYKFSETGNFQKDGSKTNNDIQNYDSLLSNLTSFNNLITENNPSSVFTLGGDCGLEVIPISYLNKKYGGNLSVI